MALTVMMLLFLPSLTSAQEELQCHIQGECSGSFVGFTEENDYNGCLSTCQNNANCNWFSFNSANNFCLEYTDCLPINPACTTCFTGQKECIFEAECEVNGFCDGHIVAYNTTSTPNECLQLCQQFDNCYWYSYFSGSQACFLMEDCTFLDESCSDCLTGEKDCYAELPFNQLLVVGGRNAEYKVELVDLSGKNNSCQLNDFHIAWPLEGAVGTYIGGKAMVCGGSSSNRCFVYNPSTDNWNATVSMSEPRQYPAGVLISPTEWWITGGYYDTIESQTGEVYTAGEAFSSYTYLPESKVLHNIVRINSTHYILLGGNANKVWMLDTTVQIWSRLPDLLQSREDTHAGLVTYPDCHQAIVVAGGFTRTTEVFNLDEQVWTYGPELPIIESRLNGGASVQQEDTFLIVGGYRSGYSNAIFRFDPTTEMWIELEQKLSTSRMFLTAFLVPDNLITCP